MAQWEKNHLSKGIYLWINRLKMLEAADMVKYFRRVIKYLGFASGKGEKAHEMVGKDENILADCEKMLGRFPEKFVIY